VNYDLKWRPRSSTRRCGPHPTRSCRRSGCTTCGTELAPAAGADMKAIQAMLRPRELLDHRRHVHRGAAGVAVGAGRGMSSVVPRLRSIAGPSDTGAPTWPRHPDPRESIAWPKRPGQRVGRLGLEPQNPRSKVSDERESCRPVVSRAVACWCVPGGQDAASCPVVFYHGGGDAVRN
jgi:hypothetical protein